MSRRRLVAALVAALSLALPSAAGAAPRRKLPKLVRRVLTWRGMPDGTASPKAGPGCPAAASCSMRALDAGRWPYELGRGLVLPYRYSHRGRAPVAPDAAT